MNGDNIANAFKVQVLNYSIQTSLFDIIMVAFLRFLFLLIFYGLFIINHWSVIFVSYLPVIPWINLKFCRYSRLFPVCFQMTTAGSCGFLIGKVFYYNVSDRFFSNIDFYLKPNAVKWAMNKVSCSLLQWIASAQPILQVVMIIVSCLLAWGEAWFLDCRVIPQEKNARRWHRSIMVYLINPIFSVSRFISETRI